MAKVVETVQRLFTVEEYHRMAETGILGPDERVELVRGIIRKMSPKNRAYVIATDLICERLREALEGRARVYQEAPLVVEGMASEPEPDVMVCSNPDRRAYGTSRTKAVLVIEVAESSLGYDLGEKAEIYAEAGIPEYWVVDLVEKRVVVLREPKGGSYRVRFSAKEGEALSPEVWPELAFQVSEWFERDAAS